MIKYMQSFTKDISGHWVFEKKKQFLHFWSEIVNEVG